MRLRIERFTISQPTDVIIIKNPLSHSWLQDFVKFTMTDNRKGIASCFLFSDVNECDFTPRICAEDMDCENTEGSYKCVNKAHPHKVTKVLRKEDYDSGDENEDNDNDDEEDDDDDDNDDYGEEITETPQSLKCEDGFKRNENLECVGEC